jgi:hypothetical protein
MQQHFSQEATEALDYMKAENDQIYKYDNIVVQNDRERYSGPENVWSYYDPVHQPTQNAVRSVIGSNRPVSAVPSGQYSLFGKKRHSHKKSRSHKKRRSLRRLCEL